MINKELNPKIMALERNLKVISFKIPVIDGLSYVYGVHVQ